MKHIHRDRYDDLVLRLTAHRTNVKDVYVDKHGYDYIKGWFKDPYTEVIPYIKISKLINALNKDLIKLEALKSLECPESYIEQELGFQLVTGGEWATDEGGLDTVINFIKKLIDVLEDFQRPYGLETMEFKRKTEK